MTTTSLKSLSALLTAAALSTSAGSALPLKVSNGSNFTLDFNGSYDANSVTIPGLRATVTFSDFAFSKDSISGSLVTRVDFNYSIHNGSSAPVLSSRVSHFAFSAAPGILASTPNSVSGFHRNGGKGFFETSVGDSASGSASIYFAGQITSFAIDNAMVRYESVTCSYDSPYSHSASGVVSLVEETQDPGSWFMQNGGLALIGALRGRRA